MKNKLKIICLALAMALAPVTGNALADGHDKTGPYVGMGFGKSELDMDVKDDQGAGNIKFGTWSPAVFGGFMPHPNFGVEGGLVWLGDDVKFGNGDTDERTVNTFYLAGVGKYQFADNVAAYAKAGVHRWSYEGKFHRVADGGTPARTTKLRLGGVDPMFGVGVQFDASERTSFRLEWSRYVASDKKDGVKYDGDLDVFGVQMLYRL